MSSHLLDRVAAGEAPAMQEVIDRYGGLVWSLARRLLPTAADAEDAVQDAFIAIWKNAGNFDPAQGEEVTFVAMIARRRLIDALRKVRRRRGEPMENVPEQAEASPRPEPVALGDEAARASAALRELRPEQREVLRLAVHHGLTHEQIARHTGMPIGTVKTHVRRGLIRVREALAAGRGTEEPTTSP